MLRPSKPESQIMCNQLSTVLRVSYQDKTLNFDRGVDTNLAYYQRTDIEPGVIRKLWCSVRSQLGGNMSFYHRSFHGFLIDRTRSGIFWSQHFDIYRILFEHCHELRLASEKTFSLVGSSEPPGSTSTLFSYLYVASINACKSHTWLCVLSSLSSYHRID